MFHLDSSLCCLSLNSRFTSVQEKIVVRKLSILPAGECSDSLIWLLLLNISCFLSFICFFSFFPLFFSVRFVAGSSLYSHSFHFPFLRSISFLFSFSSFFWILLGSFFLSSIFHLSYFFPVYIIFSRYFFAIFLFSWFDNYLFSGVVLFLVSLIMWFPIISFISIYHNYTFFFLHFSSP